MYSDVLHEKIIGLEYIRSWAAQYNHKLVCVHLAHAISELVAIRDTVLLSEKAMGTLEGTKSGDNRLEGW